MRRNRTLASALFAVWGLVAAGTMALAWSNRAYILDLRSLDSEDLAYVAASTAYTLVYAIVGTVVVLRTGHVIGRLLVATGIAWLLPLATEQYGLHGVVVAPGSLPAVRFVGATNVWTYILALVAVTLILLLFPTGRAHTPRWRPLVAATPAVAAVCAVSAALRPGPVFRGHGRTITNPFGLAGLDRPLGVIFTAGVVSLVAIALGAVVSLVLRFRASDGVERRQVKWLAFVAVAAAAVLGADIVVGRTLSDKAVGDAFDSIAWGVLVTTVMLGFPLAIGAAVLRYRLYDIDRLVSRTLAYVVVSALLAGGYAVIAVGLGTVARGSSVVVAAATLAVAGLFRPVRDRVQRRVDRRFNRTRYDAARTVEAFARRLRDEVAIGGLAVDLKATTLRAVQPSSVALWLREPR